jgi:hypothetical protein
MPRHLDSIDPTWEYFHARSIRRMRVTVLTVERIDPNLHQVFRGQVERRAALDSPRSRGPFASHSTAEWLDGVDLFVSTPPSSYPGSANSANRRRSSHCGRARATPRRFAREKATI